MAPLPSDCEITTNAIVFFKRSNRQTSRGVASLRVTHLCIISNLLQIAVPWLLRLLPVVQLAVHDLVHRQALILAILKHNHVLLSAGSQTTFVLHVSAMISQLIKVSQTAAWNPTAEGDPAKQMQHDTPQSSFRLAKGCAAWHLRMAMACHHQCMTLGTSRVCCHFGVAEVSGRHLYVALGQVCGLDKQPSKGCQQLRNSCRNSHAMVRTQVFVVKLISCYKALSIYVIVRIRRCILDTACMRRSPGPDFDPRLTGHACPVMVCVHMQVTVRAA